MSRTLSPAAASRSGSRPKSKSKGREGKAKVAVMVMEVNALERGNCVGYGGVWADSRLGESEFHGVQNVNTRV